MEIPEDQREKVTALMVDLIEAARDNPNLDVQAFVRDRTSEALGIPKEQQDYLRAHGASVTKFPEDHEYENLWDLYGLTEKAFTVMVQQAKDLAEQDPCNTNPEVMEAWLQGYMVGVYMERQTVAILKEGLDA